METGQGMAKAFPVNLALFQRALLVFLGVLLSLAINTVPASAQQMLLNRSFETPVVPNNGNNFYATLPNWTFTNIVPANPQPVNLIRPFAGYANNPQTTPAGGGIQYLDVNAAAGLVRQVVTFTRDGNIDYSAWFSVRDAQRALTSTINIRDGAGVIISSATANHLATDPIGLWRQAARANVPVRAGSYTFELVMDNFANVDLTSLIFKPGLTSTKSSVVFSDPINATNPKAIPGSFIDYTISASNPAAVGGANPIPGYSVTSNSLRVGDATPPNLDLFVGNLSGVGSGPATFNPGTTALTYTYISLASTTDSIEFSNNSGTTWTYTPIPDASGFDPTVTNVRIRPNGIMTAGTTFSFRIRYRVR